MTGILLTIKWKSSLIENEEVDPAEERNLVGNIYSN